MVRVINSKIRVIGTIWIIILIGLIHTVLSIRKGYLRIERACILI